MAEVRLIDANALLDKLPKVDLDRDECITKSGAVADMMCLIISASTIEAEPVRHGRWRKGAWKTYPDGYVCSKCNYGYAIPYNYCPNCGARMDAKEEQENDQG